MGRLHLRASPKEQVVVSQRADLRKVPGGTGPGLGFSRRDWKLQQQNVDRGNKEHGPRTLVLCAAGRTFGSEQAGTCATR
jgi:hypothetical protein